MPVAFFALGSLDATAEMAGAEAVIYLLNYAFAGFAVGILSN